MRFLSFLFGLIGEEFKSIRSKVDLSLQLVQTVMTYALDKKAEDISVLEMRDVVNFCDYFVICTGTSDRHVRSIALGIEQGLDEIGVDVRYKQGLKGSSPIKQLGTDEMVGSWVILDMGNVVVHVFEPNAREFYNLEYLWRDAPKVILKSKKPRKTKSSS